MRQLQHGTVELVQGTIVHQNTDAIVNAANTTLLGGGGVDGAIHRAAGPALMELCRQLPADDQGRRCQTGHVQTTAAGNLAARCVIHAVGPYYSERSAARAQAQLRQVHLLALQAAVDHHCRSIAFPAISTGAYRFPLADAARISVDAACMFLDNRHGLDVVRFVLFHATALEAFQTALAAWSPPG